MDQQQTTTEKRKQDPYTDAVTLNKRENPTVTDSWMSKGIAKAHKKPLPFMLASNAAP
jgi:hypothetical protein